MSSPSASPRQDPEATSRVAFRRPVPEDGDALYAIYGHPTAARHLGARTLSREDTQALLLQRIAHHDEFGFGMWMVVEQSSGATIGTCGLLRVGGGGDDDTVEIGWALRPDRWGEGFASEVAGAVLTHAFESVGLSHVTAFVDEGNLASIRVAEKLGMRLERRGEAAGVSPWLEFRIYASAPPGGA